MQISVWRWSLGPFLVLLVLSATPTRADEPKGNWFSQNFIDPEDAALDLSTWLDRGGFFPVPLIITEPAVDNGLGLAAVFIHGEDPDNPEAPPDVTGAAGPRMILSCRRSAAATYHAGYDILEMPVRPFASQDPQLRHVSCP